MAASWSFAVPRSSAACRIAWRPRSVDRSPAASRWSTRRTASGISRSLIVAGAWGRTRGGRLSRPRTRRWCARTRTLLRRRTVGRFEEHACGLLLDQHGLNCLAVEAYGDFLAAHVVQARWGRAA